MRMSILEIVLYGPEAEPPRVVPLRSTGLNVIAGYSKTGKSSLISIVDYCLGAGECDVPGVIRQHVRWYAVRLQIGEQQAFVARKAPDPGRNTTSDAYYALGHTVEIPSHGELSATTNAETIVQMLSRAMGIGDYVHEPRPGETRRPVPVNMRHGLFFCFQQQDQIISRKHLFHKQSEPFIPRAIQDVLPYFLGAVDDDYMIKKARLARLLDELKRAKKRLQELEGIRGQGWARAHELIAEASDLGMIAALEALGSADDWEVVVQLLRRVANAEVPSLPEDTAEREGVVYEDLVRRSDALQRRYERTRQERDTAKSLLAHQGGYADEGKHQLSRLKSIGVFTTDSHATACPLCQAELEDGPNTAAITRLATRLEEQLAGVATSVPHLEKLVATLEDELQQLRGDLRELRQQLDALHQSATRIGQYRDRIARIAHVQGRASLYLESLPEASDEPVDLQRQIASLEAQIEPLREELSADSIEDRLDSILGLLSNDITAAGKRLNLEHSDTRLSLNRRKLQVVADTPDGPVPMERIGSGANWVGYHVVVHLALHRWFSLRSRPVPGFLFLDQPSQIGFPAETLDRTEADDEDLEAVRRMLRLVWEYASDEETGFQAIVTEHAEFEDDWFQDAIVEQWRDGRALIPTSWLDE